MAEIGMNSVSGTGSNKDLSIGRDGLSSMINDIVRYTDGSNAGRGNGPAPASQTSTESRALDIVARAHSELGNLGNSVNSVV